MQATAPGSPREGRANHATCATCSSSQQGKAMMFAQEDLAVPAGSSWGRTDNSHPLPPSRPAAQCGVRSMLQPPSASCKHIHKLSGKLKALGRESHLPEPQPHPSPTQIVLLRCLLCYTFMELGSTAHGHGAVHVWVVTSLRQGLISGAITVSCMSKPS